MNANKLRRFISGVTAMLVCACAAPLSASAHDAASRTDNNVLTDTDISLAMQTSIPRMLWAMENKPEYLNLEAVDSAAVMGEGFTIADIRNGSVVEDNSIVYYPISSNGNITAILTLVKCDGEVTTTIGQDFSDELESALSADSDITLMSVNDCNIVAVDDSGSIKVLSSDGTMSDSDISGEVSRAFSFTANVADKYTLSADEVYNNSMAVTDVIGLYSKGVETLREDFYTSSSEVASDVITRGNIDFGTTYSVNILPDNILYTYDPYATAVGDYLDTYQVVAQGSLPICWAATVASMLRWELPSVYGSYSATDVCDALGHTYTGASVSLIDDYLTTLLTPYNNNYIPTYQSYAYQESTIRTIINNEDPAYMSSYGATGGRHGTALCGYLKYSDDTFAIRIMNPGTGAFQLSDRAYSSTTFRYAYNGTYFTWDNSVRFYYNHS